MRVEPVAEESRARLATCLAREVYRRELLPERVLWWLAAEGMRDWYRVLAKRLAPHVATDTKALLSRLSVRMFERRREALAPALRRSLGESRPGAGGGRELALLMGALYRVDRAPRAAWIFDALGGSARTTRERLGSRLLIARSSARERWEEVTTHLGELLVVLTEDLPAHLPHARKILGDICFDAGARYAARVKKAFAMPPSPAGSTDPPRDAMEVLRMSEYVFRVNPEHWSSSDGTTGWLEGSACPWWSRPGWNGAHCGIFGQFQSGIASEFGLRYHLSKTIPKHGGHTCRIDVKPIPAADLARHTRSRSREGDPAA